jgi:hypothetical protein
MERNAHKQLNINNTKHTAVTSSMMLVSLNLKNFIEVNTRKQNPNKLDAEFNISGDLLSLSSIAAMKLCRTRE